MPVNIPTIETARLRMRAFREDDFEQYAVIMADPEVTRYLGDGNALSRAEAWRQMAMILGHWQLRGYGLWAVEEKETGVLLGRIGCFYPEGFPRFEVGYTLGRHAWGKGYASEGAAAALHYARTVLKRTGVTSVIKEGNVRSAAVASRLGATHVDTVPFYNATAWIYQYPDT